MLAQRRRRWANNKTTLVERVLFDGDGSAHGTRLAHLFLYLSRLQKTDSF